MYLESISCCNNERKFTLLTPAAEPPALRFAILRVSSIGDVVLATACLDLVRVLSMPIHITWVGRNPSLDLIAKAYPNITTIDANPENPSYVNKVVEALQDMHFVLDLQMSIRSRSICRMLSKVGVSTFTCDKNSLRRGQAVVAARLRGRRSSLPESYQAMPRFQFDMMVDALKKAIRSHLPVEQYDGIAGFNPRPKLPTSHDEGELAWQKELKFGKWLAIAPGASYETKIAPEEFFLEVLSVLNSNYQGVEQLGLVFVGSEADRSKAISIIDKSLWRGGVLNLAGKLSLWESCLAIKEAKTIFSNDSSLCHIAEAVGVPSLVVFGPTIEAFGFAPWRSDSQAFSSPLGCRPCSKHGKADCRYKDKLCFKLVSPEIFASKAASLLELKPRKHNEEG